MHALDAVLRTQRILWGALAFAPANYCFVARSIAARGDVVPNPVLPWVFAGLALSLTVVSFVLPARIFTAAMRARGSALRRREFPAAPQLVVSGYRDAEPRTREVEDPGAAMLLAARLDMAPLIVTLAMREAIAAFGLLLAVLGHPFALTVGFCAVGVVLILLRFPNEAALRRRAEQALEARIPV